MANVLVSADSMTAIANAIRAKKGVSTQYKPNEMPDAISSISGGGGITPTGTINITQNGTVDVTNYASANVNVPTGGGSSEITDVYLTTGVANISPKIIIRNWDFTESLTDPVSGLTATLANGVVQDSNGLTFTAANHRATMPSTRKELYKTYEIDFGDITYASTGNHQRLVMWSDEAGLVWNKSGYWGVYRTAKDWVNTTSAVAGYNNGSLFSNKTLKLVTMPDADYWYLDDVLWWKQETKQANNTGTILYFGSTANTFLNFTVKAVRVYIGA